MATKSGKSANPASLFREQSHPSVTGTIGLALTDHEVLNRNMQKIDAALAEVFQLAGGEVLTLDQQREAGEAAVAEQQKAAEASQKEAEKQEASARDTKHDH